MGLPAVLAGVSIAASVGGTLVAVKGARATAAANAEAAEYNAAAERRAAMIAERDRSVALAQSYAEASDADRSNRRSLGRIRAQYGNTGFKMEGSPLDVLEDTAIEQALDISRVRYAGRMRAAGYEEEANSRRISANMFEMQAGHERTAGKYSVAATILGGIGNVAGMGYSMLR